MPSLVIFVNKPKYIFYFLALQMNLGLPTKHLLLKSQEEASCSYHNQKNIHNI